MPGQQEVSFSRAKTVHLARNAEASQAGRVQSDGVVVDVPSVLQVLQPSVLRLVGLQGAPKKVCSREV